MSEDSEKALSTALARIAQMEAELSGFRSKPTATQDQEAARRAFLTDPVGFASKMGVPVDHITKVFVAHAMGDQAPDELKMLARMGPQMSATSALESEVKALRQRLEATESASARESFKTLSADKSKYPHLSAAFAADPSLFESDVSGHKGSASDLATALEGRLAKVATALGVRAPQPASEVNADRTAIAQEQQAKPAPLAGSLNGHLPSIQQSTPGVLDENGLQALKDEIVRKYSPAK